MHDYVHETYSLLDQGMTPDAAVEALMGVAYELRTANLLAAANLLTLDRMPGLMLRNGMLGGDGDELLSKISTQILERLSPEKE